MWQIWVVSICIAALSFYLGFSIGRSSLSYNGQIILDKNEDGDDRIIFQLGMEYDELENHDKIIFKIKRGF